MSFQEVKTILNGAIAAWTAANGGTPPKLVNAHRDPDPAHKDAVFGWETRDQLLASTARGIPLVQHDVIGNGKGDQANLVVALARSDPNGNGGVINPATGQGFGQMPDGGPFLTDDPSKPIAKIIQWINDGCHDD